MGQRIKLRSDTAANWTSTNPILADGELGYDKTNKWFKTGDGVTAWVSLQYLKEPSFLASIIPSATITGSFTHNLGAVPTQIYVYAECIAANNSYIIGDVVHRFAAQNFNVWADALSVNFFALGATPTIAVKGSSTIVSLTNIGWRLRIKSFR